MNRVVVWGDSIVWGAGATVAPDTVVAQLMADQPDWNVQNFGQPGVSAAGTNGTIAGGQLKPLIQPITVLYAFGFNDWGQNVDPNITGTAAVNAMKNARAALGSAFPVPWVLSLPVWSTHEGEPNPRGKTLADYRLYLALALSWNHVDAILDPFAHQVWTQAAGWQPAQGTAIPHDSALYVDGVHMNSAGQALLAVWLAANAAAFVQ